MNQNKIKSIESSYLPLPIKLELLLILSKQKPSTSFFVVTKKYPKINPECWNKCEVKNSRTFLSHIRTILDELNIPHTSYPCQINKERGTEVIVGKSQKWVKKLQNALKEHNTTKLGECYGFPKTAIKAFHDKIPRANPKDIAHRKIWSFVFVHSTQFLNEEFKTIQNWERTIKKLSPFLYKQATK